MFNKKLVMGVAAAVAVTAYGVTAQAEEMTADMSIADPVVLASNCFNCHGMNGASVGIIDALDEVSARSIAKKMREFRSGAKAATIMNRIAKGYSNAEIEAIANYIASQNEQE